VESPFADEYLDPPLSSDYGDADEKRSKYAHSNMSNRGKHIQVDGKTNELIDYGRLF